MRFSRILRPSRRPAAHSTALWILFGITLLALFGSVLIAARNIIGSFERIEMQATAQKAMQVSRAFAADLSQLTISNRDYAQWDDAQSYVKTGDASFIAKNFTPETLSSMHVDVVWIGDPSGHERYSAALDRAQNTLSFPAPASVLKSFQRFLQTYGPSRTLSTAPGIVPTSAGLAAVSAFQISRTDLSDSTDTILLFGRFIRKEEIERVQATSQLPVSLTELQGAHARGDELPQSVRAWLTSKGPAAPTFVYAPDERLTSGYALIRDFEGRPVAVFATTSPRDIFALGYRTTRFMLGGIAALVIAFGAAVAALMVRLQRSFASRQAQRMRFQRIASQLRESLALVDRQSLRLIEANDTVLAALGCRYEELASHHVLELFPDLDTAALTSSAPASCSTLLSRLKQKGGTWVDAEVTVTVMDDGPQHLLTLVGHDISHRKQAQERERANRRELLKLAQQDALTGLPNRRYLHGRLPQVLNHVANGERLLALMYVDIDYFKNINDSRGHACGDLLLQILAKRLRAAISIEDMVARMGGDEFVVVATFMPDRAAIDTLASRIQTAITAAIVLSGECITVSTSIGIAVYPQDGLDVDTLQKHADIALYQAKEAGRRCHRFFSAEMDLRLSEQVSLEQALRHAVGTEQVFLEYQPVVDLQTGRLTSLEALMRWRHPERGIVPPSQFIPVAEKTRLIVEMGEQALRIVIDQQRQWLDMQIPLVPIAVNVSPLQLERADFVDIVVRLARERGVDPKWLRFEITESAIMKEPEALIRTLAALRALGCQILIDDFGTGYSSLSYLNRLPIDVLKIDQAFVRDLNQEDSQRTPIISAIIDMARNLELTTIAEGVETLAQADKLRAQGCEYAQGYLYARPMSADMCEPLLVQRDTAIAAQTTEPLRAAS